MWWREGFGDTLVSKTCHFVRVSHKGSLNLVFCGTHICITYYEVNLAQKIF